MHGSADHLTPAVIPACRRVVWLPMLLVAMGVALRIAFFTVSACHIPTTPDEAMPMLQAKGVFESGSAVSFRAKQAPRGVLGRFPLLFMAQPYCFPVESYMMAPLAPFLPRNAFGARLLPAIFSAATAVLSIALLWQMMERRRREWCLLGLVLVPSAYWLVLEVAFALPGSGWFLLASAALFLLLRKREQSEPLTALVVLTAGLLSGLSVSGSLLLAPLLVAAAAMAAFNGPMWQSVRTLILFAVGSIIGLIPYQAAKLLYPGAYGAVSGTVSCHEALGRMWDPIVRFTLPAAFGIQPCYWPDNGETLVVVPGLARFFGAAWLLLLAFATVAAASATIRRARARTWPSVGIGDAGVIASWVCLMLCLLSRRTHASTYRYLSVAVWAFPFVLARVMMVAPGWGRRLLRTVVYSLVAFNALAAVLLMRAWSQDGFAANEAYLYDVQPVARYLTEQKISRCYASWQASYRLTYETDERILCAQFFNERFSGWPVPYRDCVNRATNVAYVLHPRYRVPPALFEESLATAGVAATTVTCGTFVVYSDFNYPGQELVTVPHASLNATASHEPSNANRLVDGDLGNHWTSGVQQTGDMWLSIHLDTPRTVARILMYYDELYQDHAEAVAIGLRAADGSWVTVVPDQQWQLDPFNIVNGHPAYLAWVQTIAFAPTETDGIRIAIAAPQQGRCWSVSEVEVQAQSRVPTPSDSDQ